MILNEVFVCSTRPLSKANDCTPNNGDLMYSKGFGDVTHLLPTFFSHSAVAKRTFGNF